MKRVTLLFIVTAAIMIACSSSPEIEIPEDIAEMENVATFSSIDPPLGNIEFERVASYGDTDDLIVGQMSGAGVGADGRVYLADASEMLVHIYESDGTHIQSIGGQGEGPGEFTGLNRPIVYEDHLYAVDFMQQRISAFSMDDYSFDYTINYGSSDSDMMGFPEQFTPLNNGNYLMVMSRMSGDGDQYTREPELVIMDNSGEILDSEMVPFDSTNMLTVQAGNGFMLMMPPYLRQSFVRSNSREEIVYANSDRMFIRFFDLDGNYKRGVYHSHTNIPVNRSRILDNYENDEMRSAIRGETMPETMPVFDQMHLDDEDRIWFAMVTEEEDEREYWLIDYEGERLAAFTWPDGRNIQAIKDNHVYTLEENEMGLHEIVKHSIRLD